MTLVDAPVTSCPVCGDVIQQLGKHCYRKHGYHPPMTVEQQDVITGWVMGDATVQRYPDIPNKNPYVECYNTNKEFLKWTAEKLGWLAKDVYLHIDAETAEKGFNGEYECQPLYALDTVSHPEISRYVGWYESGEKRFPEDMGLTPMAAKVWYACDGGLWYPNAGTTGVARFRSYNERDRGEYICDLFREVGFSPRAGSDGHFPFTQDETEKLLEWMGEPPNGMEYKWEYQGEKA